MTKSSSLTAVSLLAALVAAWAAIPAARLPPPPTPAAEGLLRFEDQALTPDGSPLPADAVVHIDIDTQDRLDAIWRGRKDWDGSPLPSGAGVGLNIGITSVSGFGRWAELQRRTHSIELSRPPTARPWPLSLSLVSGVGRPRPLRRGLYQATVALTLDLSTVATVPSTTAMSTSTRTYPGPILGTFRFRVP